MRMLLRTKCKNVVLATEIPCKWKFATKSASDCECEGLVHSALDHIIVKNQEGKNSLKIKFLGRNFWDIRDPDVAISYLCKAIFIVIFGHYSPKQKDMYVIVLAGMVLSRHFRVAIV